MNKIKMLVFSILFTVLYSAQAQAANYYSLTGDKNFVLNAFDKYFNPSIVGIIGTFLDFYGPICLMVAAIIAAYILIVGTVTTAHEGEMLGKKWSSLWVPIRAPLAVSLLLPVSNGWAVIQLIVMALAVQGTEWGDAGWKKIAPSLITDSTYISVTNKTAIRQLVVN
ncbi:DotA/TraY family protein, partial [Salmonella enterica]|nr:DotA/TraY family protein [Salmonella enterica]